MREYANPPTGPLPQTGNLTDDVVSNARDHPEAIAFRRRTPEGWAGVTTTDFLDEVSAVARGFVTAGLEPGDRVALISKTRYEWTVLDYAIWTAGLVSVPIYETSSAAQIAWILSDSAARAVITETHEHSARVSQVRAELPQLHHMWAIDDSALTVLDTLGRDLDPEELEKRRVAVGPDSPATLIYTSGTTGRPKGCVLTHGNFMYEVGTTVDELGHLFDSADSSTLLFMPLAHVLARIVQLGSVRARVQMGHACDIRSLLDDFEAFGPTFILAVPRVFEKIFNTASQRAVADGNGRVFQRAVDVAIAWSRAQDERGAGPVLRAQHMLFDRLVYRKLRAALGGRCQYAISGGAPLGERLGHFYRGIGVTILEGYGLTESTAALTVNLPDAQKVGTVGRPLAGTSCRVADDGELLFRGGQIFREYWNNPTATVAAKDSDGWFHTGDLGEIDSEGFVRITGRKKEILVTAGGKNVAPTVLEDRIRAHALIDQCMVVGDGQPFVAAIVTVDRDAFESWCSRTGKSGSIADHAKDPDLLAEIQEAVDDANSAVSRAESVRKFVVLPIAWTEEGGQLTASLKLKRNVVLRECADDIERIYAH